MAPTEPTANQRLEELEDSVANLETKITEMVSRAVEQAVSAMKHSLVGLLLQGQAEQSKKHGVRSNRR